MVRRSTRGSQRERSLAVALELPGAVLTHPFGDDVDVCKVGVEDGGGRHAGGKMFALVGVDEPARLTLKVVPDRGEALVREHPAITPGYHTDKRHWITIALDGSLHDDLVRELVEDSYDLVVSTLTARARFQVDPSRFPMPVVRRPSDG
jgi:predicted DNA-binding protein (MmcQ/YjbR family)